LRRASDGGLLFPFGGAGGFPVVAFSPDGQLLAMNGPGVGNHFQTKIVLVRVADGTVARRIPAPIDGPISALAFSPDGQVLAMAQGGVTELVRLSDGALLRTLTSGGWSLAFSPDGQYLATADAPDTLWRVSDGAQLWRPQNGTRVTFSPDGHL